MRVPTRESVLFVTLDSCRFDTFDALRPPALGGVGTLYKAQAPSYFTYGSHSAMFVGFTPGVPGTQLPILNPKAAKLFKLVGPGYHRNDAEGYSLSGRNIIDGFKNKGFLTIGAGAMAWFDPATETGQHLSSSFERFIYTGNHGLQQQVAFVEAEMEKAEGDVFCFINVGETHVPYWHAGADWSADDSPCVPFQTVDRAAECRHRQTQCLAFADRHLQPLLERFAGSTILVCGDHGDCWGEDGLWEHGISHWATLTVPLMARVRGKPVDHAIPAPTPAPAADPTPAERPGLFRSLFNRR